MNRHLRVVVALVLLGGAVVSAGQNPAPAQPSAGPQTPTFRVNVDYVEVDVLVTDAQGNYVRELKKEDFQVFEDGKAQTIANFVPIDIPVERGEQPLFATQPVDPDVRGNEQPFNGRVYVMVLDSAHTLPQNTNLMRNAAKKFISEKLGTNDLMAVVTARGAAGGPDDGQEFTNNKRLLLAAVDKFRGTQPRAATLNKIDDFVSKSAQRAAGADPGDPQDIDAKEREYNARMVLEELTAVADWFSIVRGRKKSILYFSEGISYDIHDVFANQGNNSAAMIQLNMQDLVRATTKANAVIYAIDPRGLLGLPDGNIELQSVSGSSVDLSNRALEAESRLARESLQTFAGETGGFAVVNTNKIANAFDRIVDENSSYYLLGYRPPDPRANGKLHRLDVKVNRKDVIVRTRNVYAAEPPVKTDKNGVPLPPPPPLPAVPLGRVAERVPEPAQGLAEPQSGGQLLRRRRVAAGRLVQAPAERDPDVLQFGLDAVAGGEGVRALKPGREFLGQIGVERRVGLPDLVPFPGLVQCGPGEGLHGLQHARTGLAVGPVGDAEQRGVGQLRDAAESVGSARGDR